MKHLTVFRMRSGSTDLVPSKRSDALIDIADGLQNTFATIAAGVTIAQSTASFAPVEAPEGTDEVPTISLSR